MYKRLAVKKIFDISLFQSELYTRGKVVYHVHVRVSFQNGAYVHFETVKYNKLIRKRKLKRGFSVAHSPPCHEQRTPHIIEHLLTCIYVYVKHVCILHIESFTAG